MVSFERHGHQIFGWLSDLCKVCKTVAQCYNSSLACQNRTMVTDGDYAECASAKEFCDVCYQKSPCGKEWIVESQWAFPGNTSTSGFSPRVSGIGGAIQYTCAPARVRTHTLHTVCAGPWIPAWWRPAPKPANMSACDEVSDAEISKYTSGFLETCIAADRS